MQLEGGMTTIRVTSLVKSTRDRQHVIIDLVLSSLPNPPLCSAFLQRFIFGDAKGHSFGNACLDERRRFLNASGFECCYGETYLCRKRLILMVLSKTNDSDCERRMKDRGRSLRQSRSQKSSTPPATFRPRLDVDVADDKRRRPKASLSPKPDAEKNRSRPRHQARKDWVAEWEQQTSPITVECSSHEFLENMSKTRRRSVSV